MFYMLKVTEILSIFIIWKLYFFTTILLKKIRRSNIQGIYPLCQGDNL